MEEIKKSTKKKYLFFILIIVIIIFLVYFFTKEKEQEYDVISVEKGDLIQEVSVIGRVEPSKSVDLAFEKSGRVAKVNIDIGDQVVIGQILVELDNNDLTAQLAQDQAALESVQAGLRQYEAGLDAEKAKLDELKAGAKLEEVQVSETRVSNAEKTLADARVNLENVKSKADIDLLNLYDEVEDILNDAYFKADDALNKQIDDLFSNDSSVNPTITFSTSDLQAKIDVEQGRVGVEQAFLSLKADVDNLSSLALDQALNNGEEYLVTIRNFLNRLNEAVNTATGLSLTVLSTYKTNINTARTNINTAITNINSQKQLIAAQKITNQNNINTAQTGINTAQSALTLANDELILKKSGATDEQIRAQESQVRQAELNITSQGAQVKQSQAKIENVQAQLAKTVLKSPINGVIVEQEAKVGEIISLNTLVLSIISEIDFEIKANVPEADIAKISLDDLAEVTLDAYGSDIEFDTKVTNINPAEKIIEGVATYQVTLNFINKDERVKSGMTADVNILTAEKKDVLMIPSRTILKKNGEKFIKLLIDQEGEKTIKEVNIETGLRGSGGKIEIIKGLELGDQIVLP